MLHIVNPYRINRGALCVLRMDFSSGYYAPTVFQLLHQDRWKEWDGVFSYLGD